MQYLCNAKVGNMTARVTFNSDHQV